MRKRKLIHAGLLVGAVVVMIVFGPLLLRELRGDERQVDPILQKENLYIELTRVEGINEAGVLRVYGVIAPPSNVQSSTVMVNGNVVATGGAFTAGDFTFTVGQNLLLGNSIVEITLVINGEANTVGFLATRDESTAEGSDSYYEVYAVEGFGTMPYTFPMFLTERYAEVTYSITQSGRTALANQSELLLSNLPQGEMGDPFLANANHVYVAEGGNLYPAGFGSPEYPVIIGPNDIYRECVTKKWITPDTLTSITYGQADVIIGLDTPAGPNFPCSICLLSDNDVEAPDQVGQ